MHRFFYKLVPYIVGQLTNILAYNGVRRLLIFNVLIVQAPGLKEKGNICQGILTEGEG
jgi:hypothetical protein